MIPAILGLLAAGILIFGLIGLAIMQVLFSLLMIAGYLAEHLPSWWQGGGGQ